MSTLLYIFLVAFLLLLLLRVAGVLAGSIIAFGSPVAIILIVLLILVLAGKL